MTIKLLYQKSDEIGVFIKLTNSFCLIPNEINDKCLKILNKELKSKIPIIKTSILNSKCIGRLLIGNSKGIVVPFETTEEEFINLQKHIPDHIIIKRSKEKFSALGNCISNNDYSAIVHPEISHETEELLADVLGVEVFKLFLGSEKLIGSYCVFNNKGGVIFPMVSVEDQDEISSLLQIPLLVGTVNCGSKQLSSGIIVNDWISFCGFRTTQAELFVLETAFNNEIKIKSLNTF